MHPITHALSLYAPQVVRFYFRSADLGRNALTTASWVSMYGPPIRSTQYGTAANTPSSVSRIALGWPGRLMIKAFFRTTATWRDRIAVGTYFKLTARICSPKPGITLSATARVASGVTSRGAGPVPPVVRTRLQ